MTVQQRIVLWAIFASPVLCTNSDGQAVLGQKKNESDGSLVTLRGHDSWIAAGAYSPDGTLFASGSSDDTLILWDAASSKQLKMLKANSKGVTALTFSPDSH